MNLIKNHKLLILAIVLAVASFIYICLVGDTYVLTFEPEQTVDADKEITAEVAEDSPGSAEVLDVYRDGNDICVKLHGGEPGRIYLMLYYDNQYQDMEVLFVHKTGTVTRSDYYGHSTGSFEVRLMWVLYLGLVIVVTIRRYGESVRENMYQYKNILHLGIIFFLCLILVFQIFSLMNQGGAVDSLYMIMNTLTGVEIFTFPIALVVFIMVTISNIKLLKHEGKTWRNMLGVFQGFLMIIASVAPIIIGTFFQTTDLIDVHNWRGFGRFVEMFVENTCGIIIIYAESILVATIVLSLKAAKHVPKFDKDYILIHGCQIKKDGTLTKLLQSRADRAVEFAEMQKEVADKDIIFVPSGGQGSDEVVSEAEAIKNYLVELGISEDKILLEDKSVNTKENIQNAIKLIHERSGEDAKIAFATTNYHVFRTGLYATEEGVKAEGIGSPTKSYFWVNAFVREFIATIYAEKKTHLMVFGVMMVLNILMVIMTYISNVVLS